MTTTTPRQSGLLLHLSSLPGPGGTGDLGVEAHNLIEALRRAGQTAWQVLPLGPTGFGDSPYQPFSAFAGNPLFVSLEGLVNDGLLRPEELHSPPPSAPRADFEAARAYRAPLLALSARRLVKDPHNPLYQSYQTFCAAQVGWLDNYALFIALKEDQHGAGWTAWDPPLRDRDPKALSAARERLIERIEEHRFVQWQFFRQWRSLRDHAAAAGVELIGDMPIFLAHDSVEVWSEREQFRLDPDGGLVVQAGVPPDYFSQTGQLWGNPLYDWGRMALDGFSFWKRRMHNASLLYDRVRIDHFRGFAGFWEIPGGATTAASGRWVTGPGAALFEALLAPEGRDANVRLIAEDLGIITPDVEELRDRFAFPGMRVLEFSFGQGGPEEEASSRPYGYRRNLVVYTSTHDNNTLCGWFHGQDEGNSGRGAEQVRQEQQTVLQYLGLPDDREIHWALIRLALSTVADLVILPVQDLLGLSSEARMNFPGHSEGNWRFRLLPGQLDETTLSRLHHLTRVYGRR